MAALWARSTPSVTRPCVWFWTFSNGRRRWTRRMMRRIEHAQLVDPQDQPRFGALGVAASVQPVHLRSDAVQEREAWGIRADKSLPAALHARGWSADPRLARTRPSSPRTRGPGIAVAVCRRDPFDAEAAPVGADHAITLERSIRAACLDPALVAGRQDLGRLVPGALADLIVVPGNRGERRGGSRGACRRPSACHVHRRRARPRRFLGVFGSVRSRIAALWQESGSCSGWST